MTDVMEHPALADVYARAGASDKDRDQWLMERLSGVTATQARDLYLLGPGYRAQLLREKVEGTIEPELRNKYVAWGNKREPWVVCGMEHAGLGGESDGSWPPRMVSALTSTVT